MDDSVMTCDEFIESYDEEIKTISTNVTEKKLPVKGKVFVVYLPFCNYYNIIDSCWYLLLSDKISSKKILTIS